MWKSILQSAKAITFTTAILYSAVLFGQQNIIVNKDNTHPEIDRQSTWQPAIFSFNASWNNGYNEIQWTTRGEQDTRKFIVEYSTDGIYYQTAGEALATSKGVYLVKHQTFEIVPILYRLKVEDMNGQYSYSKNILLDGIALSPVRIYPTIISGNVVNVNAYFPVERITIFNGSGQQVYVQDIGGKSASMTIVVPNLAKGMYWMAFSGRDWKTTEKFIVP